MSTLDPTGVYVIAEAGVNHNGDPALAHQLLEAAAAAGADAIKFQTFKAASLVTDTADMADYQKQNTGRAENQRAMLERLELSYEVHLELAQQAEAKGIDFLSTAFDEDSLEFLDKSIGVRALKIASGEITNTPIILKHAALNRDVILSTGMATLAEIEEALAVLAFGWSEKATSIPSEQALRSAYMDPELQTLLRERVTLLHCTTQYPTPAADVNLRSMTTLADAFGLPVGYSDHTLGIVVPIAAVARGAVMIEKHFTLDREMEGPDHAASLEPDELAEMISGIRTVEQALGSPVKGPCSTELSIVAAARKSIVAATTISAGQSFTAENLAMKRPGTGRPPRDYWQLLDTPARRDYQPGDLIVD